MQRMAPKLIAEKLQNPATRPNPKSTTDYQRRCGLIRNNSMNNNATVPSSSAPSHRSRLVRTCSVKSQPTAARFCGRGQYGRYMAPARAGEVLIKRALVPPKRRLAIRWWNFRPTPSRLSNMSAA